MSEPSALDKAFHQGVMELKQATSNALSWSRLARRRGDMQRAEDLRRQFLKLNGLLIEVGFLELRNIDESEEMHQALDKVEKAAKDLQKARSQMRSVTKAIEQGTKIIGIVEDALRFAARFAA